MYTSTGFFALAGFLIACTGTASAQELTWTNNYQEARVHGQKVNKPLAVFVGKGPTGHQQLIQEGILSSDIRKIIATEFIPVYLDASKAENQALIASLGITSDKGIVLSDHSGQYQAFFHDGNISELVLTRQLGRFADPSLEILTTTTISTPRLSYYPSMGEPMSPAAEFRPSFNSLPSSSRSC